MTTRRRFAISISLAAIISSATASCAQPAVSPTPTVARDPQISGVLRLQPHRDVALVGMFYEVGAPCDGVDHASTTGFIFSERFHRTVDGSVLEVRNGQGDIVGLGRLAVGEWRREPHDAVIFNHFCEMSFSVQVDMSSAFYVLVTGDLQSDPYTAREIEEPLEIIFTDD